MRAALLVLIALLTSSPGQAQAPTAPVVNSRGVQNAFTMLPAPAQVAQGGLLRIGGLNLGPPQGLRAEGAPWPTELGAPPIRVLINNRPAPLRSAGPSEIICQVPYETPPGLAQVVVQRGDQSSRPARFNVLAALPSLRTMTGTSSGPVAGQRSAQGLTITATGLGITEPRVESGAAAPEGETISSRLALRAYVGGLSASLEAALSRTRVGEFDIQLSIPERAQPGDVVQFYAGGRLANLVTLDQIREPQVSFLRFPADAPEIRGLMSSDLRPGYGMVNGAADREGCYSSLIFDFQKQKIAPLAECLVAANRNQATPAVALNDNPVVASFVGPAAGQAPAGVSNKVLLMHPELNEPLAVELPAAAATLGAIADGSLVAVIPGETARTIRIDPLTGEQSEIEPAPGGAQPGAGGGGGQGAILQILQGGEFDLGDGVKSVLSPPINAGQNLFAFVVADNIDKTSRASLAIVNPRGELQAKRDFPSGWLPLVAPAGAARPGAPAPQPGAAQRRPAALFFDAPTRLVYVLGRKSDASADGLVVFPADDTPARALVVPDGWFFASCSPQLTIFNLELARSMAFFGARTAETTFRQQCPSQGFLVLDLAARSMSAAPLPSGQLNTSAAIGDVNDFLFGTNTDPSQQNSADAMFVFDPVTASSFRMDVPVGTQSFAGSTPVPELNLIITLGRNRVAGDAGFVVFDLERTDVQLLPVPDGFLNVQAIGVFPATRKLIARAVREGNTGANYVIYDLASGDASVVSNPEGVAWVGAVPTTPGQPGGGTQPVPQTVMQRPSPKSNSILAIGYDSDRRPVGLVLVRIP